MCFILDWTVSATHAGIVLLVGLPLLYLRYLAFSQCSVSICGIHKVKVKAGKQIYERGCLRFFCMALNLSGVNVLICMFIC